MIKFFRKIRQKMLSENRFSKYLIYAIGEILLVVIGILIALSINSWNQDRIDTKSELEYLGEIKKEIQANIDLTNYYIIKKLPRKIEGLSLAKQYCENKIQVEDTLSFLNKVSLGGVITNGFSFLSSKTYDELLNTGNFQLIATDSIKIKVKNYYWGISADTKSIEIYRSDFTKFMSKIRPFNPSNPEYISNYDQKEMMKELKSTEFQKQVDLELSYAYSMQNKAGRLNSEGLEILKLLDNELNKK